MTILADIRSPFFKAMFTFQFQTFADIFELTVHFQKSKLDVQEANFNEI